MLLQQFDDLLPLRERVRHLVDKDHAPQRLCEFARVQQEMRVLVSRHRAFDETAPHLPGCHADLTMSLDNVFVLNVDIYAVKDLVGSAEGGEGYLGQNGPQDLEQLRLLNGIETCLHVKFDKVQLWTIVSISKLYKPEVKVHTSFHLGTSAKVAL